MANGERHAAHGRDQEAAAEFERAARAADRRVDEDEANYRQARHLEDAGDWRGALSLLDALAAREPHSRRTARATFDAATIRLEQEHEVDVAITGLERIIFEYSDEGPASRALTVLIRVRGLDMARLETIYSQVGQTMLGDDVLNHIAHMHRDQEDSDRERAALERIVQNHPYPQGHRWDEAILRLAELDVAEGQPAAAIARLEEMLERAEGTSLIGSYTLPTFPEARMRISRLRRDQQELEAASSSYEQLGDDFPDSRLRDDALYEAGDMWLEAGQTERACAFFERVLEVVEVGHARRHAEGRLQSVCP